jgi:hypothetical protein
VTKGRYLSPDDNDLTAQIAELKRRIDNIESGNRIGATSIDQGSLTIRDPEDGSIVFAAGEIGTIIGLAGSIGFVTNRADGTRAFLMYSPPVDPGGGFWGGYDHENNVVLSNDGASGQGLARPYIGWQVNRTSDIASPPVSTSSGTFVSLWTLVGEKQHPKIRTVVLVLTPGGTTGEVQLRDPATATIIDGPDTVGSGTFAYFLLEGSIPGTFSNLKTLDVEARVTGGAGAISLFPIYAVGKQS